MQVMVSLSSSGTMKAKKKKKKKNRNRTFFSYIFMSFLIFPFVSRCNFIWFDYHFNCMKLPLNDLPLVCHSESAWPSYERIKLTSNVKWVIWRAPWVIFRWPSLVFVPPVRLNRSSVQPNNLFEHLSTIRQSFHFKTHLFIRCPLPYLVFYFFVFQMAQRSFHFKISNIDRKRERKGKWKIEKMHAVISFVNRCSDVLMALRT